jgi:hypothetical protein
MQREHRQVRHRVHGRVLRPVPELSKGPAVGFFQIGGGIAGDFPICVVPSIKYDLEQPVKPWAYFCQISDSTTSYGSYSGATPNEKITWDKLTEDTPMFVIESDATIVAPLMLRWSALLECKAPPVRPDSYRSVDVSVLGTHDAVISRLSPSPREGGRTGDWPAPA